MTNSKELFSLLIIFVFAATVYGLGTGTFQIGTYHDDAHYVVLAESLASGRGYWLINSPIPQSEYFFPPGYPLLLSGLVWFFPQNLEVLKVLSVAFCLGSVGLVYALLKVKGFQRHYVIAIAGLIALHPLIVGYSGQVMSEAAYLFLSLLSFYLMEQWLEGDVSPRRQISLGFVLALATMTRTPGVLLLLVILVREFVRKRYVSAAVILVGFLIAYSPHIIVNLQNGGGLISPGYQEQLVEGGSSLSARIAFIMQNLEAYVKDVLPHVVLPVFGPRISNLMSDVGLTSILLVSKGLLLLLLVVGFVGSTKQLLLINSYTVLYFLALLQVNTPWAGNVHARYIVPILPFVLLYLVRGIELVSNIFLRSLSRSSDLTSRIVWLMASVLVVLYLGRSVQGILDPVRNRITDISVGAEWFRANTSPEVVIMSQDPVSRYLYIRRHTVEYPTVADAEQVLKYIDQQRVDYIIVAPRLQTPRTIELDEYTAEYFLPTVLARPDEFVRVYKNDQHNVSVYQVVNSDR